MDMSPEGIEGESIGRQEDRGISKGSPYHLVQASSLPSLLNLNKEIDQACVL